MPKLIIKDVDTRIDGEYECQLDDLTNRELHFVRQVSGIAATGIIGGLLSGDAGLVVALTSVVLEREGKAVDLDALWDAQAGDIVFDFRREDDVNPPEQPPSGGSETGSDAETTSGPGSSGSGSSRPSGRRPRGPKATGGHG